jgi:quinol monooxygenase YgiN
MAIHKTARYRVRREGLETCLPAIRELVAAVQAGEPGTRLYLSMQEQGDETRFLHLMIFEDAAAEERHRSSDAVRRFTRVLYPLTVDGVEFTDFAAVASTQGR